jgi:hypothetical protein
MTLRFAAIALAILLAAASALIAGPVRADEQEVAVAAETFRAGEAAYERGDFEAAARSFEVSHRLAPHAVAIFNAGLAWEAAEKLERAADAFNLALSLGGLDETRQADAKTHLDALSSKLGRALLAAPEGTLIWLAHAERASTPITVYLTPGEHPLKVLFADGSSDNTTVQIEAGKEVSLQLSAPAPKPKATPGPVEPKPDTSVDAPASDGTALIVGGAVTLSIGVLAGVAAIGMGVAALDARDEFEASGNTDANAHDQADTLRTATNVTWVAAGLLAATGAVLLIVAPKGDASASATESARLELRVAPSGVGLAGRF